MSPTTAPNEGKPQVVDPRGADPGGEQARERMADAKFEVPVLPPDSNPPLPFVTWPVPPKDLEGL